MRIPKSFQMGPHFWRVHFVTAAEMAKRAGDDVTEGLTVFETCEVLIVRKGRSQSYVDHIFWHELTHILAKTAGMSKLGEDEDKVDLLGGLLCQAVNTFK